MFRTEPKAFQEQMMNFLSKTNFLAYLVIPHGVCGDSGVRIPTYVKGFESGHWTSYYNKKQEM